MPLVSCPTCLPSTDLPAAAALLALAAGLGILALAAVAMTRVPTDAARRVPVRTPIPHRARPVGPDDVEGLLRNAQAAAERRDLADALVWSNLALRASPGLPIALFCRGACLLALGRHEEAIAALREASRADLADVASRVLLARAAVALGRHHEAMDALREIAEVAALREVLLADPQLAGLRDHPRFLAMLGVL